MTVMLLMHDGCTIKKTHSSDIGTTRSNAHSSVVHEFTQFLEKPQVLLLLTLFNRQFFIISAKYTID